MKPNFEDFLVIVCTAILMALDSIWWALMLPTWAYLKWANELIDRDK